jgi:DNA-binding response OmpR family regulator
MAALIHELEVHLLFVDDEASIAKMEGQALERPGYTVGDIL